MSWLYLQTGTLIGPDDRRYPAYSGKGEHKNVPTSQNIEDWGPIPSGVYTIGEPRNTTMHGPFVLPLTPDPANEMFGRSEFLIHGNSLVERGSASEGCIVTSRAIREAIHNSQDKELRVVAALPKVAIDPAIEAE